MTIETIITLDLKKFRVNIPDIIHINLNSKLKINIRKSDSYMELDRYFNSRMELYFVKKSPFGERLKHTVELRDNIRFKDSEITLFEGTADRPGHYKYGISIYENGDRVFDEDPYIVVF